MIAVEGVQQSGAGLLDVDDPSAPVTRTIAIREDQTLEQLHEAFRLAFGWADPHLYTFWVGSEFWSREAARYSAPFELAEDDLHHVLRR